MHDTSKTYRAALWLSGSPAAPRARANPCQSGAISSVGGMFNPYTKGSSHLRDRRRLGGGANTWFPSKKTRPGARPAAAERAFACGCAGYEGCGSHGPRALESWIWAVGGGPEQQLPFTNIQRANAAHVSATPRRPSGGRGAGSRKSAPYVFAVRTFGGHAPLAYIVCDGITTTAVPRVLPLCPDRD